MKGFEVRVLVIFLMIFLVFFWFLPDRNEDLFKEELNFTNSSSSEREPIDYVDSGANERIVKQIVFHNGTSREIENLSELDEFLIENEISEKNEIFNEVMNLSNISNVSK